MLGSSLGPTLGPIDAFEVGRELIKMVGLILGYMVSFILGSKLVILVGLILGD